MRVGVRKKLQAGESWLPEEKRPASRTRYAPSCSMACGVPRSCRSGGSNTLNRKSARPTGAKAQAFHKLSGKTTSPAPTTPSMMRKTVQARGVEPRVSSFGKVRETANRESATDSRKRATEDSASPEGRSPGRIGGVELVLIRE